MCRPTCDSNRIVMNGINATGKQNHRCQDCGKAGATRLPRPLFYPH
ncbi:transposase-like zinc-binding domain-containing protein [Thiorhodococcus mannitoliphagus]